VSRPRLLTAAEVQKEFPALRPQAEQVGLVESEAGVLAPSLRFSPMCASLGAELHFGEKVVGWDASDSEVVLRTESHRYEVHRLVLTAGGWSGGLWQLPDLPLPAERQVMLWFAPADIGPFTPPLCPSYRFERTDGTQYYGVPTRDGRTAKAARQYGGEFTTAEGIRRGVTEADVAGLRAGLAETVPERSRAPLPAAPPASTPTLLTAISPLGLIRAPPGSRWRRGSPDTGSSSPGGGRSPG
jgi:glycine/D-amino acid oxidase-like deaminating enzyme